MRNHDFIVSVFVCFVFALGGGVACRQSTTGRDASAGSDAHADMAVDAAGDPGDGSSLRDALSADANSCVLSDSDGSAASVGAGTLPSWTSLACCNPPPEPADAGPPEQPVSFSVAHGITPEPDGGTATYVVPEDGNKLSLSPRLSTIPAGATLTNATISVVDLTRGLAYPSSSTLPFAYDVGNVIGYESLVLALPPGLMAITYELDAAFAVDASASTSSFTVRGFQLATICGGGTLNAVLPEIPPLALVHVTIDQLQNGSPPGGILSFSLTTLDRTFSAHASTTVPDSGASSVVLSIQAPLGVPLVAEIAGAGVVTTLALAGDTTVSMPVLVQGYGTITTSDAINAAESSVVCTVPGPAPTAADPFPPAPQTFNGAVTGPASPYSYSILVPKGVSCALSANLAIDVPGEFTGFLASPTVPFDGSVLMQNFVLPPLAGQATFHVSPMYPPDYQNLSSGEHFRAVSTSLDGSLDGWTYSKDFNHLHTFMDWGMLLPGTYNLFESGPD